MIEFFQGLWSAITSGNFQAVLSLIGAALVATAPVWSVAVKASLTKIKTKSGVANDYIDKLIKTLESEKSENAKLETANAKLMKYITAVTEANNTALQTIVDRSNLKEDVKQSITNTLSSVKSLADVTAIAYVSAPATASDNTAVTTAETVTAEQPATASTTATPIGL